MYPDKPLVHGASRPRSGRTIFSIICFALFLCTVLFVEATADPDAIVILPLDEGGGTVAGDVSGMGNDGTLMNGAVFEANTGDGSASAVRFDGVDDYIDLGVLDVVGTGLTLACWFNADAFPGPSKDPRLISKASGTSAKDHVFMLSTVQSSGAVRLRARVRVGGSTTTLIASSGNLVVGEWRHAAVTYDGATLRLYLDGFEVGSTPLSGAVDVDPAVPVAVGNQPPGAGPRFFDGLIDDVRILQRAMSAGELASLVGGNQVPVAVDDGYGTSEDVPLVVDVVGGVLANDTDGDLDPLSAVLEDDVSNGLLTLNADGSFGYTPNANFNGVDSFTYRANDGAVNSNLATVTLTVDPINDAPVAVGDDYETAPNTLLSVNAAGGVLANDTDVDLDVLQAVLVDDVTDGVLALNADGSFDYTPDVSFTGTDTFTYRASDGLLDSLATVTIDVVPPPTAVADGYVTDEDVALVVPAVTGVLSNDTDTNPPDDLTAVLLTSPTHGTLTPFGGDGSFTYVPGPNFNGVDSFTYQAVDGGNGATAQATVTLTINAINDAPVAVGDGYQTSANTLLSVNAANGVLDNDTDVDLDALQAVLEDDVTDGVLMLNGDGSFDYTPNVSFVGTDGFTYRASDGSLDSLATVTIDVTGADADAIAILPMDEGGGSTAADVSGNGNDGTLMNGAVFEANTGDGSASAVRFDGADDYVDLGVLDVAGTGLTLACWFNADAFPGAAQDPRLISKASGEGLQAHVFMLSTISDNGAVRLRGRIRVGGSTTTLIAQSGILDVGEWRHAAMTYDGATLRLYLDAIEVASTPLSGPVATNPSIPVAVGSQPPGAGVRFFDGLIDDVRILQRAMSASEIAAIAPPRGPVVKAWYGDVQDFGAKGNPQTLIQVLGRVSNTAPLTGLSYRLNGGPSQNLTIGPDGFRLVDPGDYAIEIDNASLNSGANTVEITAVDALAQQTVKTVTVNYTPGVVWSLPDVLDWQGASSVTDEVQVVDGLWQLEGGEVRTLPSAIGYDRLLVAGNYNWAPNYEVVAPLTVHSIPKNGAAGIAVGWQGHTGTEQPKLGHPYQAIGWIFGNGQLQMLHNGDGVQVQTSVPFNIGTRYILKVRSEVLGGGQSNVQIKWWAASQAEPGGWNLSDNVSTMNGSVLLIAHMADVTFGEVSITPLSGGNQIPVAVDDGYGTSEDVPLVVDVVGGVLANDTDGDSDPLQAVLQDDVSNGLLTLNADGSFGYTPNANFNGVDSLTYRANDGSINSNLATVTLTVDPINDAPVAVGDGYQTQPNTLLSVNAVGGVLANDTDVDLDPLQAVLVDDVTDGVLTLNADGSFDYTPDVSFTGTDSFTYRASDGLLDSLATVTIVVVEPPTALDDGYGTDEDVTLVVAGVSGVLSNDVDNNPPDDLTAVVVTGPTKGTLSLSGDGGFSYVPDANVNGVDSFTYAAVDGGNGSTAQATVILTVNAINDAPVAVGDGYQLQPNTLLSVNAVGGVLANDTDVDLDALQAVLVGDVSNGVLTLNADGSFDYMPDLDFTGSDSFMYQASDTSLTSNVVIVTLTVSGSGNNPPQIVTGKIVFTKQTIGVNVDETHAVVAADLDGDGDIDAAATDYIDDTVFWYENDGNGGFVTHVLDANLDGAYPLQVGDVDQDGDSDLLACGYLGDTIVWYANNGGGAFTRHVIDAAANGAHSVVTGDMDLDGDVDLLATNQDDGSVTWYENDGNENFTRHLIDASASGAKRAEFADIDGDGDWDVVSASWNNNQIAWHENDGNQNFSKRIIDTTADGAYYVFPADVDGDGDVDVLSASQNDNTIGLYENNGSGNFTARTIDTNADGARTVIAVDIDRDGDVDVVSASVDDDTIGRYENDGNGNFTEEQPIDDDANGAYGVFAIDMENDGDVDVFSASRDANAIALHEQIMAHVAFLSEPGGTLIIGSTLLLTTDTDDGPTGLTYTITDGLNFGELRVDGILVPPGGTFTQDDINNDRLAYVHDGSPSLADVFSFTVADGGEGGLSPASGTFTINIADPSGLAHWPLDETSGLVAPDIVSGFDGTLVGGPTWLPTGGRMGGALSFDGTDDYVDLGTIDIPAGNGMTISLWLRAGALGGSARLISKATSTAEQDHYWMISKYGSALRFRLRAGGATSTLLTQQNLLVVGEWYHVACSYDQNAMHIYVNGTLLVSLPKTGTLDVNPAVKAAIGDQPPGAGDDPFNGVIDDVRIYERALSATEIAVLANPPVAVAYHPGPLEEGAGAADVDPQPMADPTALHPNVPNPFNPSTTIRYNISQSTDVTLQIFDVRGRLIRTLVNGHQVAGGNSVLWDGRDNRGVHVHSGVYFVRLRTPQFQQSRKIVLIE